MTFLLERVLRLSEQFFHCLCEIIIQNWIRFNSSAAGISKEPELLSGKFSEQAKFERQ